jgi:dipeptidyl aminopeptidase/acylaminoacyl peptidase
MIDRKVGTPEYERPFKAIVDYLVGRPDIDPNRIGVAGSDFGAYNAVRAAVFEKRIKCCGIITACYDALVDLYDYGQEGHRHGLSAFLGEDPNNVEVVREKLKAYTLKGVADKLTVPLLILQGEESVNYPIEPAYRLYADAKGPKELRIVNSDHHTGHRRMEVLAGLTDWFVDHLK